MQNSKLIFLKFGSTPPAHRHPHQETGAYTIKPAPSNMPPYSAGLDLAAQSPSKQ